MFGIVNPCGVKGMQQTSLAEVLGRPVDLAGVRRETAAQFGRHPRPGIFKDYTKPIPSEAALAPGSILNHP